VLAEEEQNKIASVIVEDLECNNWRVERGPPSEGMAGIRRGN
jgi:hypothetical protein